MRKFVVSVVAIMLAAYLLPGITVSGGVLTVIIVALVWSIVNVVIKPIFTLLTLPVTVVTMGLFLLFINTFMVLLTSYLVSGFDVRSFWWAFGFSFVYSLIVSLVEELTGKEA